MDKKRDKLYLLMILPGAFHDMTNEIKITMDLQFAQNAAFCRTEGAQIVELKIEDNDPKQVICNQTIEKKIDLLVMGSRGLSRLQSLILGSVSEYCLNNAQTNVLLIKDNETTS